MFFASNEKNFEITLNFFIKFIFMGVNVRETVRQHSKHQFDMSHDLVTHIKL